MTDAWRSAHEAAGTAAHRAGWPRSYNPHPIESDEWEAWFDGWGRSEREANPPRYVFDPNFSVLA